MEVPQATDEMAAKAFWRLVKHLRDRSDVQNIDLMGVGGFCRNCLGDWLADASEGTLTKEQARDMVYGMPAADWKAQYGKQATPEQIERMDASVKRNRKDEDQKLDEAIEESFPASDPPAQTDPSRWG